MSQSLPAPSGNSIALELSPLEEPFVGRWNRLISTTNWEKGRIISEWREALVAAGASSTDYSDEAWCNRVGGVTSQHVGRLRRVHQRFGQSHERFAGLYWSHFQAAIDWDDAEMWLEGAVQNEWSVATMRHTRWETLGAVPADQPRAEDVIAAEVDEDVDPSSADSEHGETRAHFDDGVPVPEGPDFGDADEVTGGAGGGHASPAGSDESGPAVQVFAHLQELPPDLADAFDAFKLAILRHKAEAWQQISLDDLLSSLDALKELAKT